MPNYKPPTSHKANRSQASQKRLVLWSAIGLIAQIAFMLGWLIADTWQGPKYNAIKYTISDLQSATAPHSWFPIVCFAIGGIGSFLFAIFGLRPALAKAGKIAAYAPWILGFSALALGNSFPLIPCRLVDVGCNAHSQLFSPGGMTDTILSSVAFLVLVFTPSMLEKRIKALPEWKDFRPVLSLAQVICPLSFILLSLTSNGSIAGLAERILATVCALWVTALAVKVIIIARLGRVTPSEKGSSL
jgi:hypothetical membrane protein